MSQEYSEVTGEARHDEEMQDIISAVPAWILRWGISVLFLILVLAIGLSFLVRYPDIVKTQLKIDSRNSPKPIVAKISGKLMRILVADNQHVFTGQTIAYIESTADHESVLQLLATLKQVYREVTGNKPISTYYFTSLSTTRLGELQNTYEIFYNQLLSYKATVTDGLVLKKKKFLQKDLISLESQIEHLKAERELQKRDLVLANDEFSMHKLLEQQKVETSAELRQEESKYLAKKTPIIQTETGLVVLDNNYLAKQKEIMELDNQIIEAKSKFLESLNTLLSQIEEWKSKYILSAPQAGKLIYAGIIQENQVLSSNQDVFYINSGDTHFFGEMAIPQRNMGKIRLGQVVLIKLRSYPFEEYGVVKGHISYLADIPYRDSVFISKVEIKIQNPPNKRKRVTLKEGMIGDAEIVTEDASVVHRLKRELSLLLNSR